MIDPRTAALFPGGQRVLDLGCGDGRWLDVVAARYEHAVGFDVSTDRFSTRAREPETWEFVLADLDDGIPVEDGTVDGVHANQLIEHVANPLALVAEAHRVLRSGGILAVATPNVRYLKHLFRLVVLGRGPLTSGIQPPTVEQWDGGHLHFLTPSDLEWIAAQAGFEKASARALIALDRGRRPARRVLDALSRARPVREFLSGNTLLIARK